MGKKAAIGFTYDEKSTADNEEDEEEKKKDDLSALGLSNLDSDSDSSDSLSDLDIGMSICGKIVFIFWVE